MKEKVLIYILRTKHEQTEVLVFDHAEFPDVSPQVIGGSIETGEDPLKAANRETFEESGLKFKQFHYKLGEFEFFREDLKEEQLRHVYVVYNNELPDSWTHIVSNGEEDKGLQFHFYWKTLDDAKTNLKGKMGDYLSYLKPYQSRKSARAIFLTKENEVLLMKIGNKTSKWQGWITPGGGIEFGESEEDALIREIREELGIEVSGNKTKVWKRVHCFAWNDKMIDQEEVFFLINTEKFIPKSTMDLNETELLDFQRFKWWKVSDIKISSEQFAPTKIGECVSLLLCGQIPINPVDVGV